MKKIFFTFLTILLLSAQVTQAQANLYITKNGNVSFHAGTPVEDIDGATNEATSILNTSSGEVVFQILIKSFHFSRALMEEHFNENYMESSKFPKSTFKGKILEINKIDFKKNGKYEVDVKGELVIRGKTKSISAKSLLIVEGSKITGESKFKMQLTDFGIEIPSLVADKISNDVMIEINCKYEPRAK